MDGEVEEDGRTGRWRRRNDGEVEEEGSTGRWRRKERRGGGGGRKSRRELLRQIIRCHRAIICIGGIELDSGLFRNPRKAGVKNDDIVRLKVTASSRDYALE